MGHRLCGAGHHAPVTPPNPEVQPGSVLRCKHTVGNDTTGEFKLTHTITLVLYLDKSVDFTNHDCTQPAVR